MAGVATAVTSRAGAERCGNTMQSRGEQSVLWLLLARRWPRWVGQSRTVNASSAPSRAFGSPGLVPDL